MFDLVLPTIFAILVLVWIVSFVCAVFLMRSERTQQRMNIAERPMWFKLIAMALFVIVLTFVGPFMALVALAQWLTVEIDLTRLRDNALRKLGEVEQGLRDVETSHNRLREEINRKNFLAQRLKSLNDEAEKVLADAPEADLPQPPYAPGRDGEEVGAM
jgi:hypothetical protein